MSNINYDGNEIDDIINILNDSSKEQAIIKGTEQAIQREEEKLDKQHPNRGWYNADGTPMTKEQYQKMMQQQTVKKIKQKSIGKPPISTKKITIIDKTIEFIKEYKIAIAGVLAAAAIATITWGPTLKANSQINDLSNKLGDKLVEMGFGEQQKEIFNKFNLTIDPDELIDKWELTPDNHIRLYILSTVLPQKDFEKILISLGFNSIDDYVKKLGFEHGELRASENYKIEYETKLKQLIMDLNENPDKLDEYLDKYPELGLIYDLNNTFILPNGDFGSTRDRGGRK